MSLVRSFAIKYPTHKQKSKSFVKYDLIAATEKWIEYSLDQIEINKLLQIVSREEKHVLLQALKVLENKLNYMYRHPNFELNVATAELKRAKRLLKM